MGWVFKTPHIALGVSVHTVAVANTTATKRPWLHVKQESHAVARKPRDAAAVLFGLKFADNIHYKFKSRGLAKLRKPCSKHSGAK